MTDFRLGPDQKRFQRVMPEPVQDQDLTARQQRAIQLKGRVLRRRPDEDDRAVLDIGQETVLLRPVEPVNFIDEQQCALPAGAPVLRPLEYLAQVGNAGKHRG